MKIKEFILLDGCSIAIQFDQAWFEEHISFLIKLILDNIADAQIVERILGADREYVRFNWLNNQFILHFESYSQSSWIEDESLDNIKIIELFHQINAQNNSRS